MIPLQDLAAMGSGFLVAQYLRGRGINPEGDIRRLVENGNMIYTEVLEDERPEEIREVSEVESGIWKP